MKIDIQINAYKVRINNNVKSVVDSPLYF